MGAAVSPRAHRDLALAARSWDGAGRTSDGGLLAVLEAHEMQSMRKAMREYDEQDPKNPRPITTQKKRTNPMEASEALPWSHIRKDDERDRHRHI